MSLLRLIDANANRAREGLRVLEDIARFILGDAELCGECKALRHELTEIVDALAGSGGQISLLAARDTAGDVGTGIQTDGERNRASVSSIAHAAAGRIAEALRTLEESAKVLGADRNAERLESARYRTYALHQRVALLLGGAQRRQFRLCVLLTRALCTHHTLDRVAELALAGGADCLQLREKSLPDKDLLAAASCLTAIAREHGAAVFINDRVDIAILSGATGVHIGQTDLPAKRVRELCGARLLVGVSTSTPAEARAAARDGADLCGVGPMFATTTKHKPELAGPQYLRSYLEDPMTCQVPHLAIGGISKTNVTTLVEAGCLGVAVSSAVCNAPNPESVCAELLAALADNPTATTAGIDHRAHQ